MLKVALFFFYIPSCLFIILKNNHIFFICVCLIKKREKRSLGRLLIVSNWFWPSFQCGLQSSMAHLVKDLTCQVNWNWFELSLLNAMKMSKIFTHLLWSVYGISIKDRSCKSSYKNLYNGIISGSNQISSWASLSLPPYLLWSVFSNILVKFAILKWCKYLLLIITKLKRKKYLWSKPFFCSFCFILEYQLKPIMYIHSKKEEEKKKTLERQLKMICVNW